MANKKANTQNAEAQALEAVEEALSIDFSEDDISEADLAALKDQLGDVTKELEMPPANPKTSIADRLAAAADTPPKREAPEFTDGPPPPANDAHEAELANLVYSIQQKPPSNVFMWTAIASAVWLIFGLYYGIQAVFPELSSSVGATGLLTDTKFLAWMAITFLPLLPLWSFAFLMRRAIEMRHAAKSMTAAALKLLQPDKTAVQSVASVGGAIRREVAAIGNGVEQAIARAGELENMVQREVMSLERSYGDSELRLRRLVEEITHEREEVVNHAETLRRSIQNTQTTFASEIESAGLMIEDQVKTAVDVLTKSMGDKGHSISQKLNEQSTELAKLLDSASSQITQKLGEGTETLGQEVTRRAKEISEVIGLSGQAVANLMETRFAQIRSVDQEIVGKLDAGQKAFDETLERRKAELNEVLVSAGQSVNNLLKSSTAELADQSNKAINSLESNRQAIKEELEKQSSEISDAASAAANMLSTAVESGASQFESRSEKAVAQLEDSVSIRASDLENRLQETGERINTTVSQQLTQIDETLSTNGTNLVSALGMRTEALGKVLHDRTNAIGETIAARLTGFGEQMTGHLDRAVNHLSEQAHSISENTKAVEERVTESTQRVEDVLRDGNIMLQQASEKTAATISQSTEAVSELVAASAQRVEDVLNDGNIKLEQAAERTANVAQESANHITENMQAAEARLSGSIVEQAQAFTSAIDEKQLQLGQVLEGSLQGLTEALDERTTNLASKLNQGAHRIGSELEMRSRDATELLETNLRQLEERLRNGASDIASHFEAGNKVLETNLSSGKENLLQTIAQSVSDAGSAIDHRASEITELLDNRAKAINVSLGSSLVETQRNLESKTGEFNAMLRERSAELRHLIDSDAKPLVGALQETGENLIQQISGVSRNVVDEANALFANLGNTTTILDQLVSDSAKNLSAVQSGLVEGAENFSSAVSTSLENMEQSRKFAGEAEQRMQGLSGELLGNMSEISEKLGHQSNALQEAARLIEGAQSNLEHTVEAKQQSLEQLATGIVGQTQELDSTMRSFGETISKLVEQITERSKNVGGSISSEISNAIDDATSRFSDAVEAMRGAASTMREELEETRAQMRRGILELPDETAQNATAMRRVVTDQIAALRDLSAIVEKSGRMLDTSKPAQIARVAAAPAIAAAPAAIAPASDAVASAPAQPQPALHSVPRRSPAPATASVTSAPRPVQPVEAPKPQRAPAPKVAANAPSRPAVSQPAKPSGESSGWVSDLLRRASEGEPQQPAAKPQPDQRSPQHVVESLNSLSMDIASAIDHETAVDLWERYQRGETNVFTRRLYTLQGQQTFDEIRRKYQSEGEFKGAVDRYIEDFERLLKDASGNDATGMMAQTYLASDTGKVYTMLAHASGRLGNADKK